VKNVAIRRGSAQDLVHGRAAGRALRFEHRLKSVSAWAGKPEWVDVNFGRLEAILEIFWVLAV
jgi:hypothetical protein